MSYRPRLRQQPRGEYLFKLKSVFMYYVYILANKNSRVLYIGVTNDLQRRIYEHKERLLDGFTKRYNIEKLVYYEATENIKAAIEREKVLKKWSRKKKEWLIERFNPLWMDLSNDF